ncbi:peptidoglycan-binding domain-containing protein [Luteimonas flava]|uniref:peptidoglycan-binding domain-containing protein n=1 Tax=Luteimonas flava TaxID=3115822 RepID=UPI003CCC9B93
MFTAFPWPTQFPAALRGYRNRHLLPSQLGCSSMAEAGVLGTQTQAALRSFQTAHGLGVTGTMTTETLSALGVRL